MHPERAELSSVSTILHEAAQRVTSAATRAAAARDESLATALYDVERSLRAACRRLDAAVDHLGH